MEVNASLLRCLEGSVVQIIDTSDRVCSRLSHQVIMILIRSQQTLSSF